MGADDKRALNASEAAQLLLDMDRMKPVSLRLDAWDALLRAIARGDWGPGPTPNASDDSASEVPLRRHYRNDELVQEVRGPKTMRFVEDTFIWLDGERAALSELLWQLGLACQGRNADEAVALVEQISSKVMEIGSELWATSDDRASGDFYEEDEPVEKVVEAFEKGEKFITGMSSGTFKCVKHDREGCIECLPTNVRVWIRTGAAGQGSSDDGKTDDARIVYFEFEDMGTAEAFMEAVSDWLCEEVECPLALRALAIEKKLHGMGTLCPRYWLYNDASASMGPASDLRSVHESTAEPQSEFARRHQRDKALLAAEDDAGADLPEALRVAELAMDQALSTARWMQDNVPGTNLKSDTLILERGLVLVRQARRGVSSAGADEKDGLSRLFSRMSGKQATVTIREDDE